MSKSISAVAAGALALLMTASAASAATVTAKFINVDPSMTVNYTINGQAGSTLAGKFNWQYVSGSTAVPAPSFISFCIELTQYIGYGQTFTYNVVDLDEAPRPGQFVNGGAGLGMGVIKANAIRELWGRYYSTVGTNQVKAREFQLAIWEIVYDYTGTSNAGTSLLSQGLFTSSSSDGTASTWVRSLNGSTSSFANLLALQSPGSNGAQDQVFETSSLSLGAPVPLPAAALGGLLLTGLTVLRPSLSRNRR